MSKINCEICGTTYQETLAACPICGWGNRKASEPVDSEEFDFDFLKEDNAAKTHPAEEPVENAAEPVPVSRKSKDIFDYDAVNGAKPAPQPVEEEEAEEEEEEYEEEARTNPFLVVLLVVLIVILLLTSGFIFWRYYLPTRANDTPATTAPAAAQTEAATESTVPTVPCTGLSLVSGMEKLTFAGQNWLLHIKAVPEDTTDIINFFSEDESIVTVNEEGRVTAVGEGETLIVITCGDQRIECPAVVSYQEETQPTVVAETIAATESVSSTEEATEAPAETKAPASSDVVLKLKRTDISLGRRYVYVTLELDCDLDPEDVEWTTLNSNVATVNNGDVTAMGPGITTVVAKYGDQQAECIVRCRF